MEGEEKGGAPRSPGIGRHEYSRVVGIHSEQPLVPVGRTDYHFFMFFITPLHGCPMYLWPSGDTELSPAQFLLITIGIRVK